MFMSDITSRRHNQPVNRHSPFRPLLRVIPRLQPRIANFIFLQIQFPAFVYAEMWCRGGSYYQRVAWFAGFGKGGSKVGVAVRGVNAVGNGEGRGGGERRWKIDD